MYSSSQVIGMHFMNPPPIMRLVEIIRGADTSDATFSTTKSLAERSLKEFTLFSFKYFPNPLHPILCVWLSLSLSLDIICFHICVLHFGNLLLLMGVLHSTECLLIVPLEFSGLAKQ